VRLELEGGVLRDWRADDAPSLASHANDRRIWLNLRDRFPHPYTLADGEAFVALVERQSPRTFFAIEIEGEARGGVGYTLHDDVERVGAEVGYWVAVPYWGRGIMTRAVRALTRYVFAQHAEVRRVWAVPFAWNGASARVLEKAGYALEGRMRESAMKDGKVTDQLLYSILRRESRA
jgi:[ribosomal protein S5]-alanine N-acetyltransferase